MVTNLLAFHAVTGCDSISQFCGHAKKSAWPVYVAEPGLVDCLMDDTAEDFSGAEQFVVKLYSSTSTVTNVDSLRAELFHRVNNPEKLPPTHDALKLHLLRCKHQTSIWKNATVPQPNLPLPETC